MNRERFGTIPVPEKLRQTAFAAISRTQDHPDVQLRGLTVALLALCVGTGTNVRQLLESSERVMNDLDGPFSAQIRAIKAYAKNELRRPVF